MDIEPVEPAAVAAGGRDDRPRPRRARWCAGFTFQGAGKRADAPNSSPRTRRSGIYRDIVAKIRDPALLEFVGLQPHPLQRLPRGGRRHAEGPPDLRAPPAGRRRPRRLRPAAHRVGRLHRAVEDLGEDQARRGPSRRSTRPATNSTRFARARDARLGARSPRMPPREPGPFRLSYLLRDGTASARRCWPIPTRRSAAATSCCWPGLPPPKTGEAAPAIKREVTLVHRPLRQHGRREDRAGPRGRAAGRRRRWTTARRSTSSSTTRASIRFADAPVDQEARTTMRPRASTSAASQAARRDEHPRRAPRGAAPEAAREGCCPSSSSSPTACRRSARRPRWPSASSPRRQPAQPPHLHASASASTSTRRCSTRSRRRARGSTAYVLAKEDVEVKVASVFKRLSGPVLSDVTMRVERPDGTTVAGDVSDVLPSRLAIRCGGTRRPAPRKKIFLPVLINILLMASR